MRTIYPSPFLLAPFPWSPLRDPNRMGELRGFPAGVADTWGFPFRWFF